MTRWLQPVPPQTKIPLRLLKIKPVKLTNGSLEEGKINDKE